MLELIPVGLAVTTAIMAVYTDVFRDRIIPDKLTIPMIGAGICFHLFRGIWERNVYIASSGAIGAGVAFGVAYFLWSVGGWAGGDVKLFTAFGALLPMYSSPRSPAPYASDYPLFPLSVLFNSILMMVPILLIYALTCLMRGIGIFYEEIKITDLREGMIPAEYIYEKGGKIMRWSTIFGIHPRPEGDKFFANPRRAAGLTRYQVRTLKRLVNDSKLKNTIKIKKGIPFAPALAVGLLSAILYGDFYWTLVSLLGGI